MGWIRCLEVFGDVCIEYEEDKIFMYTVQLGRILGIRWIRCLEVFVDVCECLWGFEDV